MDQTQNRITLDGNEAAASVAHRLNEVIAIYPITPSSNMGEWADEWSARGNKNIWGAVPLVVEMQSEAGASAAVHGALQAGALTTTFTASQGLLLMIPALYKIAGELTPTVFHVSARSIATHALSIFGDHSDIYACRQAGWAMLAAGSVQEAHDFACIAQAASLESRIPYIHFFDGFRTSHEVSKIEGLSDEELRRMVDDRRVSEHKERALSPDRPKLRGTSQNPDVFFQAREAASPFYRQCPAVAQSVMDRFAAVTGRRYRLFDFEGAPDAERVIVIMGSAAETVQETVEWLRARGEKVGVVKVRLFRPFSASLFLAALPSTLKAMAVMDRAKEPGAAGEPLYLDVRAALGEGRDEGFSPFSQDPKVIGGRYGLSSKEFTPAMVKAVFQELCSVHPKNHFTVGIEDDVSGSSLEFDADFDIEPQEVTRGVFFGLGADGTVGANKNSIKIIGEGTTHHAQGYFVYDSKKAGAVTVSHLRFGPRPIRSIYLIHRAGFVACHQFGFLERYDMLRYAEPGAVFLLNAPYGPGEVWGHLPSEVQEEILRKRLRFFVIDAYKVAKEARLGVRINTIMQTCFFAISGVLPREEALAKIKDSIAKTYSKKGSDIVGLNFAAVDRTLANLHAVDLEGKKVDAGRERPPAVPEEAPEFVRRVTAAIIAGKGDQLPVSAMPVDGTWPTGTAAWEKRNLALEIPIWDPEVCIQCNKCSLVCPHATIRPKVYPPELLEGAPPAFRSVDYRGKDFVGWKFTLQVAPEDCTGCTLCVEVCPAKDKKNPKRRAVNMAPQPPLREQERLNYEYFLSLPDPDRGRVRLNVKGSQFFRPLFEYSSACGGCGETPYIKLLTQLFGDRALIGNATGCTSIYGGNLPATPYTFDREGRGPSWNNSLFEDTAEFTFGMRLAVDQNAVQAASLLRHLAAEAGEELAAEILGADMSTEQGILAQRNRVARLVDKISASDSPEARRLLELADYLVKKSIWGIGGDGWAYDIGYGGLDHVIAAGKDVNLLVLDTEVYSNTGGQSSKATPLAAAAKFAMAGKSVPKKDLGLLAMSYGTVYVAQTAFGADDSQTVKAFLEAESYPGPSLLICYSHCIAHGYNLAKALDQHKLAVKSGYWPLYRFDPRLAKEGKNPLQLDSRAPSIPFERYALNETRFRMLLKSDPARSKRLLAEAQKNIRLRWMKYKQMAEMVYRLDEEEQQASAPL